MNIPDFKITKFDLSILAWNGDDGSTVGSAELSHEDFVALLEEAHQRTITPAALVHQLVTDGIGTSPAAREKRLRLYQRKAARRNGEAVTA